MSYKFGFVRLYICLQCKTSGSSVFFLIFFHNVRNHRVRVPVSDGSQFLKKGSNGLGGARKFQKWPQQEVFRVLTKIFFIRMCFFYFNMQVPMVFWLFAKTTCLGKIWFFSYGSKTSRPLRMQNSLNYNISKMSWGMKLNFCSKWLDIHGSDNWVGCFKWVWSGSSRNAQSDEK